MKMPNIDYSTVYANYQVSANLAPMADFETDVQMHFLDENKGTPFPFDERLAFRDGEVTVWAAQNGQGKSLLTGQLMLMLAQMRIKSCVMSLEMSPKRTIARMMQQTLNRMPTVDDIRGFMDEFGNRLVFFDKMGATNPMECLGAIVFAAQQYGCKHVFVDNLAKVVIAEDDMNAQKLFVQSCCDIARDLGIHIHIVAHVRKLSRESDEVSKYDIRGSSAITDQPDNVIILQRNVAKEEGKDGIEATDFDTFLRVAKQRNAVERDVFYFGLFFIPEGKSFSRIQNLPVWLSNQSPVTADKNWMDRVHNFNAYRRPAQ